VPDDQLPVTLPKVATYQPTDTGESPLSAIPEWVNTKCPQCGGDAKRETNTMPQWAGSSWYFLRYPDVHNEKELASPEILKKWLPVDYYVGGIEHAVLHLLYARFYTKFLYDIGVVDFQEPFKKLFNQGMVVRNGAKMAKSKGNGVSPDGIIEQYGCDTLRMYELFIGPPELDSEWDDKGIEGVYRYLNKVWRLVAENKDKIIPENKELELIRNKMIFEITTRLENLSLNTVVSGFMEYTNKLIDAVKKYNGIDKQTLNDLIVLLAPFTPHIAEELWQQTGHSGSVFDAAFPKFDLEKIKNEEVTIVLQINGKLRDNIKCEPNQPEETVVAQAKEILKDKLAGLNIIKIIYVPNKIVNIVAK
jgi:leucyl-tRNA synthetase